MEKTARRNIMAVNKDWIIFRKILKRDLALDRMSGQQRTPLSGRREDGRLQPGRQICPSGHVSKRRWRW